jgi:predicted transposase
MTSDSKSEILKLTSVTLSREKQDKIDLEFERYSKAVNYVIRAILKNHISSGKKTFELLEEEISSRFDRRPQYVRDVVKTAWGEVREHRRLAQTVRSMRDKAPVFRAGRMIFSQPIVSVNEKGVNLQTVDKEKVPIPFDKRSRNRLIEDLESIARGKTTYARVRLTWNKEGYMDIDIRTEI